MAEELIGSHKIKCRGIKENGLWALNEELAEYVVVKVYKDGHSEPLCRFNTGKKGKCDAVDPLDKPGSCPYMSND